MDAKGETVMTLPFPPLARNSDSWTSHAAARAFVASGKRDGQCATILRAMLHGEEGHTAAELEQLLGIKAHRRMSSLERQGLVVRGLVRGCRVSGMRAVTWRLK
jgi:hypothetical protein